MRRETHGRSTASIISLCVLLALVRTDSQSVAEDWPAWRHDAARSGVTTEKLPQQLQLAWSRALQPNHVAWQEDVRLQFDRAYEPVVAGQRVVIASAREHSVSAFDLETGARVWTHLLEAPVRLAPFIHREYVYAGADDGKLHCLSLDTGEKQWAIAAAPKDRLVLGNERLISVWPNRGGVAIANDHAFYTVGIWPFEGTLLCRVKLSGDAPSLETKLMSDVSPQGHLAIVNGQVFIPGGRGLATAYDAQTLDPIQLSYKCSRGTTETHLTSGDTLLFHGDAVVSLSLNQQFDVKLKRPLSDQGRLLGFEVRASEGEDAPPMVELVRYDIRNPAIKESTDRRGNTTKRHVLHKPTRTRIASIEDPSVLPTVAMKAATQLYCIWGHHVFSIPAGAEASESSQPLEATWKYRFESAPVSLVAAGGKLLVSTENGTIHCFAGEVATANSYVEAQREMAGGDDWSEWVQDYVARASDRRGHCLVLGAGSHGLVRELLRQTEFYVHVLEPDVDQAVLLRQALVKNGSHGTRASVHTVHPRDAKLPPYFAQLIVSEKWSRFGDSKQTVAQLFEHLRPYGGAIVVDDASLAASTADDFSPALPGLEISSEDNFVRITRVGALPGSADWTHEYGDSSNTLMSRDSLVRAPMGVLWFGGPASHGDLYFNRHYWGPGLTVIEGRMIVQGPQQLTSIDIYTGEILWKHLMRDGSGPGRRGNFFEVENPGYHFTVTQDAVYLVYPDECVVLDPVTGALQRRLKLADANDQWGKVRVWKDLLIVAVFKNTPQGDLPKAVCAIHRLTGEEVWRQEASNSMPLIAVGGDRVYCFDGYLPGFYDAWKRRGLTPPGVGSRTLRAFDVNTGQPSWQVSADRVSTWMAYSPEHDIVVLSNKQGVDAVSAKDGAVLWAKSDEAPGFGGHPENVWDKVIVSGDRIIDQRGPGMSYDIRTGEPTMLVNPISLKSEPWQFTKTGHHCNYAIASPHLLTFRAGTAGFFDRDSNTTSRLDGFRSGCRNSLIPAGGVLNAPNYAHGCSCNYNLFTSLALVHMPDADLWTYSAYRSPTSSPSRIGINLNAPGDRLDDRGTLWLEFPATRDPSPTVNVETEGTTEAFRLHSRQVTGPLPWVAASGLEGVRKLTLSMPKSSRTEEFVVKLYFVEPNDGGAERRFDVILQGKQVLSGFCPLEAADGKAMRSTVHQIDRVAIHGTLELKFEPKVGQPVLSGIEVMSMSSTAH